MSESTGDESVTSDLQKWAEKVADDISSWNFVWERAAELGLADSGGGIEWEAALARFLVMTDDQREEWIERTEGWQMRNCHFDVGHPILQQDRPDYVDPDATEATGE